jgi:hypothetical protein
MDGTLMDNKHVVEISVIALTENSSVRQLRDLCLLVFLRYKWNLMNYYEKARGKWQTFGLEVT